MMIVYGCIEIHIKGCVRWIIVMKLRVLLITHYLIWDILVEIVLDVHVKGVKIKKILDLDVITIHLLHKKVHGEILILVCTRKIICSLRDNGRKDCWVNF